MSAFSIGLLVVAAILAVAGILIVHRAVVGPTILDRAVASDMLMVLMVMVLACYAAWSRTTYPGAAMLALTALGFLSTVALARFVAREDSAPTSADPRAGEGEGEDGVHVLRGTGEALEDTAEQDEGDARADR